MNTEKWFRNKLESFKEDFEFRLESLILDLTERISKTMEEKNLSRTKLAELLQVSPPAVTKILNGSSNFTLKTLLSLADALELGLKIEFKEKAVVTSDKISISSDSGFRFSKKKSGSITPDAGATIISFPGPDETYGIGWTRAVND